MPPRRRLRSRGQRLWSELKPDELGPAERVLAEEACRIADRLDQLDAVISGKADALLTLTTEDDGTVVVMVDKALSEARQQAIALKQIVTELRQSAVKQAPVPARKEALPGGVADLTARIKGRAKPTG